MPIVVRAIVQNAGQTCTAGSRLLVQRSIHDRFVARVAEAFAKVRVGTPEMDLDCGPVMNPAQHRRVQRYIDNARAAGIAVLAEGQIAAGVPSTITLRETVAADATLAQPTVRPSETAMALTTRPTRASPTGTDATPRLPRPTAACVGRIARPPT